MLTNNRGSTTLRNEELKKESKKSRFKRLKDYHWGIGLEHEMQVFHKPPINSNKNIDSFIMFNGKPRIEELLKTDKISILDKEFLEQIPFEPTGRKCNGKVVLEKTPIPMPEFVTEKPFNTLRDKRPIESYCVEIKEKENLYFKLLHLNEKTVKTEEKYGQLNQFPFGTCNYFKYPLNTGTDYKFKKDKNGKDKLHTDYLGSYHITLTLPYTKKMSLDKFTKIHQNFANQIQWLEPLLITAFFSSDQKAVGTEKKRIKGSYRIVRVGWGNLAGSDVRKFNKGIGRYANIKPYWREDLVFHNMKKANYCENLAPKLKKVEPGAVSGFSSNFRTFGSTDPNRPWHRESGIGMTKPNGVELRIFDHFDSYYLQELCKLVIYIAENSRVTQSKKYVYQNKYWIKALQNIMLHGWNAEIPKEYIDDLRKELGLKIKTKSKIAYDVLYQINEELYKKNKDGDYTYLFLDSITKPKLPEINRRSWEMGFMLKLNRNKDLMNKYNKLLQELSDKEITLNEYKKIFCKYFDINIWKNDLIDIIYFMEACNIINLKYNIDGTIESIKLKNIDMKPIKNFNIEIVQEWNRPYLEEFYGYVEKITGNSLKKKKIMK